MAFETPSRPRKTLVALALSLACTTQASPLPEHSSGSTPMAGGDAGSTPRASHRMRITVGSKAFRVTLNDNATAKAFRALLPLTLNMTELDANEKYYRLADKLPTNASSPGTIHAGDLMLYGSNTLVLFYKTFPTSYSYTRIGKVDDASGLVAAVGSGDVTVTFE